MKIHLILKIWATNRWSTKVIALILMFNASFALSAESNAVIPIKIGEHADKLPIRVDLVVLDDGAPGLKLAFTVLPIFSTLLSAARDNLPDGVSLRTLELRRWGSNGMSVKPLLTLKSCLGSNASVRGNFRSVIDDGSLKFAVEQVKTSISNTLCDTAANVTSLKDQFEDKVKNALSAVLSAPIGVANLPEPYNALPLSVVDVQFTGADANFGAIVLFRQNP